jgi:hypothetical protein
VFYLPAAKARQGAVQRPSDYTAGRSGRFHGNKGGAMGGAEADIGQLRDEIALLKQKLFLNTAVIVALCSLHDTTIEELMSGLAQNRYDPSTYNLFKNLAKHHGVDFDEFFDAIEELNPWWPFKDTPPHNTKR